jgi:hypothetical protein
MMSEVAQQVQELLLVMQACLSPLFANNQDTPELLDQMILVPGTGF